MSERHTSEKLGTVVMYTNNYDKKANSFHIWLVRSFMSQTINSIPVIVRNMNDLTLPTKYEQLNERPYQPNMEHK